MANAFWVREFGREQVPEFVKGEALQPRRIGSAELRQIETSEQRLLGLWRTVGSGKLSPLPQVILGKSSTLEDLVAWTATYVPGLCPLSRLVRLMTPSEFHKWRNRGSIKEWEEFAGGAVGLMYGEVMSYAHPATDIRTIDADMCRSTLSYVLMRCIVLGGNDKDIRSISDDWITLRRRAGLSTKKASCELIVDIAEEWADSPREMSLFGLDIRPAQEGVQELFRQLGGYEHIPLRGNMGVGSSEETKLTAEQRVRIFDEMALRVVSDPTYSAGHRGLMLAQLAYWCRKGLANQWAILQPFQTQLPECAIWLGALQAQEPMADTLFVGRAVGWKLAMELLEDLDLFNAPDDDVSFFELGIGPSERQWSDIVSATNRARVKVGIAPGVSTFLKVNGRNDAVQREIPMGASLIGDKWESPEGTEELKRLQRSLERTLRDLRRYLRM